VKPHLLVTETWAYHEALRRAGFKSDDIFVVPDANDGEVFVLLKAQGKEFKMRVGPRGMPLEEFEAMWRQWCTDIHAVSEAELREMWETSLVRRQVVHLVVALTNHGFRLKGSALLN
jgi:hypothetical protein